MIVVDATPEVLVVRLMVLPVLKLASAAPDVIVSVTGLLNAGLPVLSRRVTFTVP